MSVIDLPPIAEVTQVSAPVTFHVITGRRYLHALEEPAKGLDQIRAWRERSIFMIDEHTGLVAAETEYGTYSYYWPPAYRSDDIFTFLARLDFDYFMNKAAKQPYRVLDFDRTLAELRRDLLQDRRDHNVDKASARDRWEALASIEAEYPLNEDGFYHHWHGNGALTDWLYGADIPLLSKDHGSARYFWEVIWHTLINSEPFRAHMKSKTVAA